MRRRGDMLGGAIAKMLGHILLARRKSSSSVRVC